MVKDMFPISKNIKDRSTYRTKCSSCDYVESRKDDSPFTCGFCKDNTKSPHNWDTIRYKAIKNNDGKCDICSTTKKISVHHVDHDRTNNKEENLRVLCSQCHASLHKNEGRKIKEVYIGSCGVRIIWE